MPQHDNTAGRSVYDDVRDVREAMANNLAAENARLRQDRDSWRLVAERLQQEINEATEAMTALAPSSLTDERDRLQARLDTATAHVEELRGQRDEARAVAVSSRACRRSRSSV